MSVGRCRLVVNCGAARMFGPDWQSASRATAAHSTLTFADTSSARFLAGPVSRFLLGARILGGPSKVESRRNESDEGVWLDASHNGYEQAFAIHHRRRLFLATSGEDLRGEDKIWRPDRQDAQRPKSFWRALAFWKKPVSPTGYAVRFHLHPDAKASLAHDGTNVLVLLPNGDGWQFRAKTPSGETTLRLEESVYLGADDSTRRTEQIVVSGDLFRGEAQLNWAWRRLSTRNAGQAKKPEDDLPGLPGADEQSGEQN